MQPVKFEQKLCLNTEKRDEKSSFLLTIGQQFIIEGRTYRWTPESRVSEGQARYGEPYNTDGRKGTKLFLRRNETKGKPVFQELHKWLENERIDSL